LKKIVVFTLFFIILYSSIALCEDEVKFNADSLKFSFSLGTIVGKGNVVFSYKNLKIYADYAEIDTKEKNIFVKGNVKIFVFEKDGSVEEMKGKAAYYNWGEDYFFIDNMKVNIAGGKLKGIIRVHGETLEYKRFQEEEKIKVISGKITTCKKDPPLYYFEAKKIIIIPEKRIYAWNVSWYEGKTKIFTYPYFIIFLDRPYQLPYVPKIGYSKADGLYIKNTLNYFTNPYSWGSVYIDWYSKKGLGYGITHEWEGDALDTTLSLYYFKNKVDQDRNFKTELAISKWSIGNLEGDFKLSYKTEGDLNFATKEISGELNLTGNDKFPLKLKLTYRGSGVTAHDTEYFFGQASYKGKIFKDIDTNFSLKYTNKKYSGEVKPSLSGNLKLSYNDNSLQFTYKGNGKKLLNNEGKFIYTNTHEFSADLKNTFKIDYGAIHKDTYNYPDTYLLLSNTLNYKDLSFTLSKYLDTDGLLFSEGSTSFVDKLPELKYQTDSKNIQNTNMKYKYTITLGNYHDFKNDVNAQRYGGSVDISGSYNVGKDFKLTYLLYGGKYLYSTGDDLSFYGGELKLRVNIMPKTILEATFKQKEVKGDTPFTFDTISPYKTLFVSLKSRADVLKYSLSGGYDYLKKRYKKFTGNITYEPSSDFRAIFKLGYDFNKGNWTKLTGDIKFNMGTDWTIKYQGALSVTDMKIVDNKVVLTYNLPCERELSISYDQKKEEYWFEYNILALPTPLFSFGSE